MPPAASDRFILLAICAAIAIVLVPHPAHSLTIHGTYVTQSVPPPPEKLFDGGNIHDIFEAAADLWEAAIRDDFVIEIFYGWTNLQAGILGLSGASFVWLSNQVDWFMDPTPWDDEEWPTTSSSSAYLGGNDGPMNVSRLFTGLGSDAGWDALSVLLHEIGHALGMRPLPSVNAEVRDGDIDITSPRPFAGASIPFASPSHLAVVDSLMWVSGFTEFQRKLLSAADILALAQLNGWEELDLDPIRVAPEGLGLAPVLVAACALFVRRRRILAMGGPRS
jgi:hypothetical protein